MKDNMKTLLLFVANGVNRCKRLMIHRKMELAHNSNVYTCISLLVPK
jgi:hypothetical protein